MSYFSYAVSSTPPPLLPSFASDAAMSSTTSRESSVGADGSGESSEDELSIGIYGLFWNNLLLGYFCTDSNEVWEDDMCDDEFHSESTLEVPSYPTFGGNPDNQKADFAAMVSWIFAMSSGEVLYF